ncbi:hypothetical protein [Rhodopila sp.]
MLDGYPHTLLGGIKQRVAIAQGMAMECDILLDALTRQRMQGRVVDAVG